MMRMEKHSCCFNCEYYKAHYRKARWEFLCVGVGDCLKKKAVVPQWECCDDWKNKIENSEKTRKEAYRAIVYSVRLLSELKKFLENDGAEE